jgi:hypothetical protein
MEYSSNTMDWAFGNGHIHALNWLKDSGLKMKYSSDAMDWASCNGHIHILNWWKELLQKN